MSDTTLRNEGSDGWAEKLRSNGTNHGACVLAVVAYLDVIAEEHTLPPDIRFRIEAAVAAGKDLASRYEETDPDMQLAQESWRYCEDMTQLVHDISFYL